MGREVNVADKQVCKEECVFEWHGVPKLTELYEMESQPFQHGKTKSCVRKKKKKKKEKRKMETSHTRIAHGQCFPLPSLG